MPYKKMTKKCLYCNTDYTTTDIRQKFCSRECFLKSRIGHDVSRETREKIRLANKGRKMSDDDKEKMSKAKLGKRGSECNTFGKTWKVAKEKLKNYGKNKGAKSHLWKGGKTPYLKKLRNSSKWRQWREAVFERDNYTCLSCGKRGCEIHPHHIDSFINFPKYRFDISNGVTLCKICHYALHTKQ